MESVGYAFQDGVRQRYLRFHMVLVWFYLVLVWIGYGFGIFIVERKPSKKGQKVDPLHRHTNGDGDTEDQPCIAILMVMAIQRISNLIPCIAIAISMAIQRVKIMALATY